MVSAIPNVRQEIKVIYLPVSREDGKYENNIKRLLVHQGSIADDVCRRTRPRGDTKSFKWLAVYKQSKTTCYYYGGTC